MMTDKELLELAAKAAGIDDADYHGPIEGMWSNKLDNYWNPLTDDGDALRLAVKLNLAIYPQEQTSTGIWSTAAHWGKECGDEFSEKHQNNNNDPYMATRRAIVRAAAEIGKSI
jgi:hypothetical protein